MGRGAKKVRTYYTTTGAGKALGVSADTIVRWVDAGKLEGYRTPGLHRRISKAGVDAIIARGPGRR